MRKGHRRSHDKVTPPIVHQCPNCGTIYRPHRVCLSCGYYRGQEVITAQT